LGKSFQLDDLKDMVKELVQAVFAARRQENERLQRRLVKVLRPYGLCEPPRPQSWKEPEDVY